MYYTLVTHSPLSTRILKAGMDGASPVTVIPGLNDVYGMIIDYESSRLYWADHGSMKIQSSNLQGGDISTEVLLSANGPYGLGLLHDTIIWGNFHGRALQQRTIGAAANISTLYTGSHFIRHLTIVPPPYNRPPNRKNDCAGQTCSKVCVLTASSFSCVS